MGNIIYSLSETKEIRELQIKNLKVNVLENILIEVNSEGKALIKKTLTL